MSAADPFIVSPELEAGKLWVLLDGIHGCHKLVYVHAVDLS
jgi:hypothetical protein